METVKAIKAKVAVIGSGYWGRNLVRNYSSLGALSAICDIDEGTLERFQSQYPSVEVVSKYETILKRSDISGIVIATPAETHFELAEKALLAYKNVYVEKPLVLELSHAHRLIEIAESNQLVLMVGHLLQYHPAFVKLIELARKGELGRMNYIYSNRLNLGKIRREENILWSFAPHDISMILSLSGEEPELVSATGGSYLHPKVADVTNTFIEFPSGRKAHIFVSWLHPFKEQKLVVVGDRKMAVFDDTRPWSEKLLLYPHRIQWKENQQPVPTKADPESVLLNEAEPLRLECEHFLRCIDSGELPTTDAREGLRVLKVLKAAQLSLDLGKPVRLEHKSGGSYGTKGAAEVLSGGKKRTNDARFFAHSTAYIDAGATIGDKTKIWHFTHILSGSKIGNRCNIGQNVMVGPDVTIGDGCKIQNNVSVYKGVTLEKGVFCGPSMVFTNVFNPRAEIRKMDQLRETRVKQGVTIGANATVICGITIGAYAFIGAGAVVNKDVPDFALMVGNPIRQTGWMCHCGEKLYDSLSCKSCGNKFQKQPSGLVAKKN